MHNLFSVIKNYGRAILMMGCFAIFFTSISVKRTTDLPDPNAISFISHASVRSDIFNNSFNQVQEIHGVKISYNDPGKYAYYFEYRANARDTLQAIETLPFDPYGRVSSTTCMLMNSEANPLDERHAFPEEVQQATAFFWNVNAADFTFYECIRSPERHIVLISKTSDSILHKVESI
jgi:hypothetical protein